MSTLAYLPLSLGWLDWMLVLLLRVLEIVCFDLSSVSNTPELEIILDYLKTLEMAVLFD